MATKSAAECRVLVVGGGVIGLTSALALLQSGFKRVRVVADSFDNTTSHVAGGLWMPFSLPDDADPAKPRKWCEVSYEWLSHVMEKDGEAAGIHVVEGVEVSSEGPPLVVHPYWAHCAEHFRLLSREEAMQVSPDAVHGFAFGTIIYNTGVFMTWLQQQVRQVGGTFEERRVTDFEEESCDLLVNCTGLAAKELAKDAMVYPIRGQIIKVHNPKLDKYAAVIHRDGHHTYIIPRPHGDVVLGGTVQPHNWSTENDAADVEGVWERCCKLWPEVRNSKVIGPVAGVRPGRTGGVRLEAESRPTRRGAIVIHNYAHGGSGHTLHWGCAQDVVGLATKHFPIGNVSKL